MEPRPTIYDVAKAAGVAASTVSRAFARPGRVNADTAARIFAAARELGYRSTSARPGLVDTSSRTMALVVTDITNPFYAEIIRGATRRRPSSATACCCPHTQEDAHIEREWIERLIPTVDGVVLGQLADVGQRDPHAGQAGARRRAQPPRCPRCRACSSTTPGGCAGRWSTSASSATPR